MNTITASTVSSAVNSREMRSSRKIHYHLEETRDIPIIRGDSPTRGRQGYGVRIIVITVMLIVYTTTIVVSVCLHNRTNNKSTSFSTISGLTVTNRKTDSLVSLTTSIQSVLSTTTFSVFSFTSIVDANKAISNTDSATMSSTIMTAIIMTENVAMDDTIPIELTTESITTTTTTMIPPNLLINPGAENELDGWMQTGSSPAIVDSNGNFNKNYYPHDGSYCFAGGKATSGSPSKLLQRIQILNGIQGFTEKQIDSGKLTAFLSFYYQTWRDPIRPFDIAKVDVSFRTDSSDILGGIHTGELICKTSNPGWCHFANSTALPNGTRSIHYAMLFYKHDGLGSNIDCYIDDNSLIIM